MMVEPLRIIVFGRALQENAGAAPIPAKAMSVILTTDEERPVWINPRDV
jgi:hypothetical protein